MGYLDIFISITTGEFSEKCRDIYQKHGLEAIVSTFGHGTADSVLMDYFGLETSEKYVQFLANGRGNEQKAFSRIPKGSSL